MVVVYLFAFGSYAAITYMQNANSLLSANADAPEAVHLWSHMKNPSDMKNGATMAARI